MITKAATNADNIVGLVYVAAFAPDEGESLADIESNSKDSMLLPALVELRYSTGQGSETAVELRSSPKTSTMRTITHEEETTLWRTTVCP